MKFYWKFDVESAKLVFDLLYKIVKMSKSRLIQIHNIDSAKMDKVYSIKDKN